MPTQPPSPDRPSSSIRPPAALNLINAYRFAEKISTPLNTAAHVTFRGCQLFGEGGSPTPKQTSQLRTLLLATLLRFANSHNFPAASLWVLERVEGRGLHAHVLLYLPEQNHAELRHLLQIALEAAFCWQADIKEPVLISPKHLDSADRLRVLSYALKGIDPQCPTFSRAGGEGPSPQGVIYGKRCGTSAVISSSARRLINHQDDATPADLNFYEVVRLHVAERDAARMAEVHAMLRQLWRREAS